MSDPKWKARLNPVMGRAVTALASIITSKELIDKLLAKELLSTQHYEETIQSLKRDVPEDTARGLFMKLRLRPPGSFSEFCSAVNECELGSHLYHLLTEATKDGDSVEPEPLLVCRETAEVEMTDVGQEPPALGVEDTEVEEAAEPMMGDFKKLDAELKPMELNETCYSFFGETADAAKAVVCVCKQLNVLDSFCAVVEIGLSCQDLKEVSARLSIKNSDLVSAKNFLAKMTHEQILCLNLFTDCRSLIQWVREKFEDLSRLETFVDLEGYRSIFIFGRYYEESEKALLNFKAASAAFSPFLFDLKDDVSLNQFQTACLKVFSNLDHDQSIPCKWSDAQIYYEDFQIMKEPLSSTLLKAKVINSLGEYTVGCLSENTPEEVGDCIYLTIEPSATGESDARYSFCLSDLQDLKSSLALISGHSDRQRNEVHVFVDILESIIQLGVRFVVLCSAGHVRYLSWKQTFNCVSPSKQRDTSMFSVLESLRNQIKKVEAKMTKDLTKWKEKISEVRSNFYYLNYFTTSQLLILGRHLKQLAVSKESEQVLVDKFPNSVYGLLECISSNINASDVSKAMEKACFKLSHQQQHGYFGKGEEAPLSSPKSFGGSEEAIFGDLSIGNDLRLNSGDGSLGFSSSLGFGQSSTFEASGESIAHESYSETPILNEENTSFLTFETLGRFLQALASDTPFFRPFPENNLNVGCPNLFVVPQAELMQSVLQLYMADASLPLPSAEEVVLCTSKTTLEAVSLFWRRAINDPSRGRLFCLAGADRLSYEVSRKAADDLFELTQGLHGRRDGNYRLAVICSAENEAKSYMVLALDQFRRLPLSCPSAQEVRAYLKAQFQRGPADLNLRTSMGTTWAPAAQELDSEKCCVRVVYSTRAGEGKSLFVKHMAEKLDYMQNNKQTCLLSGENAPTKVIIPLHDFSVDADAILDTLEPVSLTPDQTPSRLIHIDVSPSVGSGLDELLFNLLVLGQITDSKGRVWHRRFTDMFVLECTWPEDQESIIKKVLMKGNKNRISFQYFLPALSRESPQVTLEVLEKKQNHAIEDSLLDGREFESAKFQRAFHFLSRFLKGEDFDQFIFSLGQIKESPRIGLQMLLAHCGVPNPSWAVLCHFVSFLSAQLRDYELSNPSNSEAYGNDFKNFVMRFAIEMSRDFSTPSLSAELIQKDDNLQGYQRRREWEQIPYPYLFFNECRMMPICLRIARSGHLVDLPTEVLLKKGIVASGLHTALYAQEFPLDEKFEDWPKKTKIRALCCVMGLEYCEDPDPTYELTSNNVIKILAIHMRFRCGIPVVIMGESGCGKTRLILYMCLLGGAVMLHMKVHEGITRNDIIRKVQQAELCAEENAKNEIKTVLFFDEVNTTDAVGLIKELMCDKRLNGRLIRGLGSDLHVIAACNPYRKHADGRSSKRDSGNLGFRAPLVQDRLGSFSLRHLVYRVHPLPESMGKLVWDFGALSPSSERLYISRIVTRHVMTGSLPNLPGLIDVVTAVLVASQSFMRDRKDEFSFVSLRDVERAMMVMVWFYKLHDVLDPFMRRKYKEQERKTGVATKPLDRLTRSLVLSLGVSYQARLQDRKQFWETISSCFKAPCKLPGSSSQMGIEIHYGQTVFLDELELPPNVARNHALKENVFVMIVCINLRIPLFLVGKPGSSKSLAKDVVKDAMRGYDSNNELYRQLKETHMASYQCSPLLTADAIISAFTQCQRMQQKCDLERFVACVVLDEVDLAEGSPRLPLKALHSLLDDGTTGADSDLEDGRHRRTAFVGISNLALDSAKMNRGILVQRTVPTIDELIDSALGICSMDEKILNLLQAIIPGIAKAYLEITSDRRMEREFFGLRDFYSLVKMLFFSCKSTGKRLSSGQVSYSIRRNFGGLDKINPVKIFSKHIELNDNDDCSQNDLIMDNLNQTGLQGSEESRYLLLLTKNYAALTILRQRFFIKNSNFVIIFGSSFSKDQEYTQICRNVNRVKVCMATGRSVVLLNLDKMYESLFGVLNQRYVYDGGQRFVDVGLESNSVKCKVHKKFRLIVIADQEAVYKDFPLSLINRMEKHSLAMSSILTPQQKRVVKKVNRWVENFAQVKQLGFRVGDAFVGYHPDAAATVVLRICWRDAEQHRRGEIDIKNDAVENKLFDKSCRVLLECATPDAVARLSGVSNVPEVWNIYYEKQIHSSLADYLFSQLAETTKNQMIQVTTHSSLLSPNDRRELQIFIKLSTSYIALSQFDTEQQFCSRVSNFYSHRNYKEALLIVLCEWGNVSEELVACARYLVQECQENALSKCDEDDVNPKHVVFVIHLPRVVGGCFVGFQGGSWAEVHIDDVRPAKGLSIPFLYNKKLSTLFETVQPFSVEQELTDADLEILDAEIDNSAEPSPRICSKATEKSFLSAAVLFRSCLHAAISRLDDPAGSSRDAAKNRLSLILRLIPEDEVQCVSFLVVRGFYFALKKRVIGLLIEREKMAGEENARHWVRKEALSQNNIHAGGTFRNSLWLKIISIVTPVLAEVIAFADVDENLRLLEETALGACNWIAKLWVDIFASPQLAPLRYSDFLTTTEPRHRVLVKSSGHQDHFFNANFPFSRLIKDEVDGMMEKAKALSGQERERLAEALQRLFDVSSVGKIIQEQATSVEGCEEMAQYYLHDFVHMVHNPKGKEDFELYRNAIWRGLGEMTKTSFEQDILKQEDALPIRILTIPTIHAAYEAFKPRLKCYADLTVLNKAVVAAVYQQPCLTAEEEMNLDTVAFTVFLKDLQPKQNDFTSETSRLAWLQRVQEAKPCLEAWVALPFEGLSTPAEAQIIWTKICAVRLYFQHMKNISFALSAGERLWKNFKNHNPDFNSVETIKLVLGFLNEANQECSRLLSSNGSDCHLCKNAWKDPVELPCLHIFCFHCIEEWITEENSVCPNCRIELPLQSSAKRRRVSDLGLLSSFKSEKSSTFNAFKSCCTAYFMEIVAVYTFNEQTRIPLNPDLVSLFMELITQKRAGEETGATRAVWPYSDAIDATPTVRSFLLQLLLQYASTQKILNYVEKHFEQTRTAVRDYAGGAEVRLKEEEIELIFVQCFEDSLMRAYSQARNRHIFVKENLQFALQRLRAEQHSLCYLQFVASARFGLCVIADVIIDLLESSEKPSEVTADVLQLVHQLCDRSCDQQILLFLLKQLVHRKGKDVLRQFQKVYAVKWLEDFVLEHNRSDDVIPDYFLVIGETYKNVRDGVAQAILTKSRDPIGDANDNLISQNVNENVRAVLLLLALYREVTMRQAYEDSSRHVAEEMQGVLKDCYLSALGLPSWAQKVGDRLLRNKLTDTNIPVLVSPEQSSQVRSAAAVALHVLLVVEAAPDNPLMNTFRYMLKDASKLEGSYLPTMPEDNFAAVRGSAHGDLKTAWHECPNGHPYFIDNCGDPATVANCLCGASIGGLEGNLQPQNVRRLRQTDDTETGHILGEAAARSNSAIPERELSPTYSTLIRCLMHASLMWGSCDTQISSTIAKIVKPPVKVDQLSQFFWDHFVKDVKAFANEIRLTADDASVVLHWFLDSLISKPRLVTLFFGDGTLKSKEKRQTWEKNFACYCIEPALREAGRSTGRSLSIVFKDVVVTGNSSLMRWLYEIEAPPRAQSSASLWRYRDRVTVEHLTATLDRNFEGKPDDKPRILREFLREERKLRALQFLPQILQLQRMLLETFHRRLALQEASTLSIKKFLDRLQERDKEVYTNLVNVFQQVWAYLGHEILTHGRLKPKKQADKLLQVNVEKTSIAFLLPTTTGKGSCAMSLVDYLINCVHNEFVSRFRNLSGLEGKIPQIPMTEITRAQLISYNFERDLVPLIHAHCNYSLKVGKGSDVTYDFATLERKVIDRFLTGKPRILFTRYEFVYNQHAYTEALFGRIEQKIPQDKLSVAVSRQIINELRDLTQLYDVLSVLDVLIGFIVSTGGDGECLVHDYLHKTLKMPEERGLVSEKACQYCRLKHTLFLWRILMVEKGRRLVLNHQDPLEDFPDAYKEDMDPGLKRRFVKFLRIVDLDSFMNGLVQLAWLEVKNRSETQGLEEYSLGDAMEDFCYLELKGLTDIPKDVQLRHLKQCWSAAVKLQASLERN